MKIYSYHGKDNISGERIKQARKAAKMTQKELAAKLQIMGISIEQNSISKLENGERFVADYEIMAISKILNVSADWLLGIEDKKN